MCARLEVPSVDGMNETHVAIVTGASRGLGLALCEALAERGYRLVVDARDGAALRAATEPLRRRTELEAVAGDIADADHRAELVDRAGRLGGCDLLVNNAGIIGASPLPAVADYPLDDLRRALEINVIAQVGLIQVALPSLRQRGGSLINITSDAAVEPYQGWSGYGAGKAAMEQVSNILAAEESNVAVWWVDPGDIRTRMHQQAFPAEDISDRPLPESVVPGFVRLVTERPPSGRFRASDLLPYRPAVTP